MPIEIRELYIKVAVSEGTETEGGNSGPASSGDTEGGNAMSNEQMIAACVEQIMEILKEKQER